MTQRRLSLTLWLTLLVAIGVNTYVGITNHERTTSAIRQQEARNCANTATLAKIVRANVQSQQAQSKALIQQGFTFGIPKAQLRLLIRKSETTQRQYLAELDGLAAGNCEPGRVARSEKVHHRAQSRHLNAVTRSAVRRITTVEHAITHARAIEPRGHPWNIPMAIGRAPTHRVSPSATPPTTAPATTPSPAPPATTSVLPPEPPMIPVPKLCAHLVVASVCLSE